MNDTVNPLSTPEDDLQLPTELEVLKQRATVLGITYSNNIGVEALRKKIDEKMASEATPPVTETPPLEAPVTEPDVPAVTDTPDAPAVDKAEPVKPLTLRQHLMNEATKLVRIRISCMDPKKQDLAGEFFTVANEYLGTIRKYVPFGEATDNGYHVPACILEMLRTREFLSITTTTHPVTKAITTKTRYIKEFNIEVLPPLTPAEIKQLAAEQAASGRLIERE